jgi:twitching motility protein PilT
MIHDILVKAVSMGASDVHLKPSQAPYFRVSGELVESGFPVFSDDDMRCIVVDMLPEHIRKRSDGATEIDLSHDEPEVGRFRVNIFMSRHVPTIALRHVKTQIPSLADLHLPPQIEKIAQANAGIIMLSGATSSGKSTTLAAMLQCINRTQRLRVITVEDPIEYLFTDDKCLITQREVGLDTPSFHSALKHVLRQDPDVIMVGEMRDDTSLRVALSAAETGHLVLTTIHANTAPQAVTRILEYFPMDERNQVRMALAGNLQAIICQRLIPAIDGKVRPGVEIMLNTPTVRKLLQKNELETLGAAIETGGEDGMQTFNQSIYKLIKSGAITERHGLEYATNPEALKMNLQGIFLDESRRILGS